MAADIATVLKIITPIISSIAKEAVSIIKDSKLKWDARASAEKLSRTIVEINTVRTMWSRDKSVVIDDFYHPPRLTVSNDEDGEDESESEHPEIIELTEPLEHNSVIEGIIGQGKSILLRKLCNLVLEQNKIPIFIELRYIAEDRDLTQLLLDFLDCAGINGDIKIFNYLAGKGHIVLILDGFDEIPTAQVKKCIYDIEHYRKKFDNLRIIISSRPQHTVQNLTGFNIYRLAQLSEVDYELFLRRLIPDSVTRFNIQSALNDSPENIRGVITTPLMLTLLCVVYAQEGSIPSSLPTFYERLFNAVFVKHDNFKPGFTREHFSGLSESHLQKLFDAFCFTTMREEFGRTLSRSQFEHAFNKAILYLPDTECKIEGFKKDIVKVASLMLDDGYEQTSFLHKSIAEYHAASFIKNSSSEFAKSFYTQAITKHGYWSEPLNFLSHIDEFRYGEMYVLPSYPSAIELLKTTLDKRTSDALITYCNTVIGEVDIHLQELDIESFSVTNLHNDYFSRRVFRHAIKATSTAIAHSPPEKLAKLATKTKQFRHGAPSSVTISTIIRNYDMNGLWLDLTKLEDESRNTVAKYQKIVDAEKRKQAIFADI